MAYGTESGIQYGQSAAADIDGLVYWRNEGVQKE